jgi:hypothetical protein
MCNTQTPNPIRKNIAEGRPKLRGALPSLGQTLPMKEKLQSVKTKIQIYAADDV